MYLFGNLCLGIAFGSGLWVILEDQSLNSWNQILFLTSNDTELDHQLGSPELTLYDLLLFPKIEKNGVKLETKRVCWISPCPQWHSWEVCAHCLCRLPPYLSSQSTEGQSGTRSLHSTVALSPRSLVTTCQIYVLVSVLSPLNLSTTFSIVDHQSIPSIHPFSQSAK